MALGVQVFWAFRAKLFMASNAFGQIAWSDMTILNYLSVFNKRKYIGMMVWDSAVEKEGKSTLATVFSKVFNAQYGRFACGASNKIYIKWSLKKSAFGNPKRSMYSWKQLFGGSNNWMLVQSANIRHSKFVDSEQKKNVYGGFLEDFFSFLSR